MNLQGPLRPFFIRILPLLTGFVPAVAAAALSLPAPAPQSLAIEHVTVLSMEVGSTPLEAATVIVRDGRIVSVSPSSETVVMEPVTRIDGRGKWLIPGFTDMHVHLENVRLMRLMLHNPEVPHEAVRPDEALAPYIAHGIVQVMDTQAMAETIGFREEVAAGRLLGPSIIAAAMIDGEPPTWPVGTTRVAATPEGGRQAVRDAAAEGYDAIKVYSRLTFETFSAIVDEARRTGLPVLGHLPERERGRTAELFQQGFRMVSHAEEFAQQTAVPSLEDIPNYVAMMKANDVWLTATLSLNERLLEQTEDPETLRTRPEIRILHPLWRDLVLNRNPYVRFAGPHRIESLRRMVSFNRALVRAFVEAEIPVVVGTDAMVPGVVPGYSLHDELAALTRAGMSPMQALEAATRLPCEWLNTSAERGTVEAGKRADLVLLDASPLEHIANTRRISAVILGGRYLPASLLTQWLETLAER